MLLACYRWSVGRYLFLKVSVGEVENLHSSISTSHSQPLGAAVKRHGSDGARHVVEESNTVHLKLSHFTDTQMENKQTTSVRNERRNTQHAGVKATSDLAAH